MRTITHITAISNPEVRPGVVNLFDVDLDGSNTRHPSNGRAISQPAFEASGLVPEHTLLGIICSELDPKLREKAQDVERDMHPTRLDEGDFQVGRTRQTKLTRVQSVK